MSTPLETILRNELLVEQRERMRVERERDEAQELADLYRAALVSIADQQSGVWGQIAHKALKEANGLLARSVQP